VVGAVGVVVAGRVVVGVGDPVDPGAVVLVGTVSGGSGTDGLVVDVVVDGVSPGSVVEVVVEASDGPVVVAAGGAVVVVVAGGAVVVVTEVVEDEVWGRACVVVVEDVAEVVVDDGAAVVSAAPAGSVCNGGLAAAALPGPAISMRETTSGATQPTDAAMKWPTRGLESLGGLANGHQSSEGRPRQTQPAGR
jgi:hypothetical protein